MKKYNKIENKPENINNIKEVKKIKNNFLLSQTKPQKTQSNIKITNHKKQKEKEIKLKLTTDKKNNSNNLTFNRNINDYQQCYTDYTNTHNGSLSWATKLRQTIKLLNETSNRKKSGKNKTKFLSKERPNGISLTKNFKEPQFYAEDLDKYKLRIKKEKRPLSSILNPNFNNIRHLFINKNGGLSKEFASSLRNYNYSPKNIGKQNIAWKKYFSCFKENKYMTKFLLPRTPGGRENLKKLEKRLFRPYNVLYKDIVLGNESIKQKVMMPDKNFTYGGIGEHLNMQNYNSRYRIKNSSYAENIFKNGTNSQCLFELSLRHYKSLDFKKKN